MDLSAVNQLSSNTFLPKKKLTDLLTSKTYTVTKLRQVKTMYGARIVVTLDDEFQVFLPPRFQKLFEQEPKLFQDMKAASQSSELFLKYQGEGKIEFSSE